MRRVLMETVFSPLLHQELAASLETASRVLAPGAPLPAATLFVLTRALLGVLHGATLYYQRHEALNRAEAPNGASRQCGVSQGSRRLPPGA